MLEDGHRRQVPTHPLEVTVPSAFCDGMDALGCLATCNVMAWHLAPGNAQGVVQCNAGGCRDDPCRSLVPRTEKL